MIPPDSNLLINGLPYTPIGVIVQSYHKSEKIGRFFVYFMGFFIMQPHPLQGNFLFCPRPTVHNRLDHRNHDDGHDTSCKAVVIKVHPSVNHAHI